MTNDGRCPVCRSQQNTTLYDDHIRLLKCRNCGIIFNNSHQPIDYNNDYFTNQYREQYGKTYAEDFDNIYNNSLRRLDKILASLNIKKNQESISLIDIGSAMGFFLKAARDSGLKDISGIEISKFAAEYCRKKFNIDVINSSFIDIKLNGRFDIITAWYFLEHCADPLAVTQKIYNLLEKNGIFALSMPSCFGPLYVFKRDEWYAAHPGDHRLDFTPYRIKNFLKKIGFAKINVFPSGIHPERLILKDSFFYKPFKAIYTGFSKIFSFSDTMEIYAVK